MQNGKLNNKFYYYKNKKIKWLIIPWMTLLLCLIIVFLFLNFIDNKNLVSLLIIVILFITLFEIFYSKKKQDYFDQMYKYHKLLLLKENPFQFEFIFSDALLNVLFKNKFIMVFNNENFCILYRLNNITEKKIQKEKRLEIINFIKNNNESLYNENLDNIYYNIRNKFQKINISSEVIIQIKNYDSINGEIIEDLDRIIMYRSNRHYISSLNVGIFSKENKIYFLHSNNFYPTKEYKYGCDLIMKIIKLDL